jgi:hypothetical protein
VSTDALSLVSAVRPGPAIDIGTPEPTSIRRARQSVIEDHSGQQRDPSELSAMPGSPGYRSKIPPPPCAECGQDHNPLHEAQGRYNHVYRRPQPEEDVAEVLSVSGALPEGVNVAPVPAAALDGSRPPLPAATGAPPRRMTLFPGKHDDTYLLVVEERVADDWDDVAQFLLAATVMARVIPIFDCLGLKIKDRTGGDLVMLRNPNDAG